MVIVGNKVLHLFIKTLLCKILIKKKMKWYQNKVVHAAYLYFSDADEILLEKVR